MQKTKLGISVGLLGAAIYFMGLFTGYLIPVLLTAYVLFFEEDEWLKKSAVKAVALMVIFSLLTAIISLVPDVMSFINNLVSAFGGYFYIGFISGLVNAVISAIDIIETVVFIGLGLKALKQETMAVPVVDAVIDSYID